MYFCHPSSSRHIFARSSPSPLSSAFLHQRCFHLSTFLSNLHPSRSPTSPYKVYMSRTKRPDKSNSSRHHALPRKNSYSYVSSTNDKNKSNLIGLTRAINQYGRTGDWEKAIDLVRSAPHTNNINWTAAMRACTLSGKWSQALDLLEEMLLKGINPDIVTYTACVKACATGKNVEEALHVIEKMKLHGIEPDLIVYTACINACANVGDWKTAMSLIDQMILSDIPPNAITYSTCMKACVVAKEYKMPLVILKQMKLRGVDPDLITYVECLHACKKKGDWNAALDLLDDMTKRNIYPDVRVINTCLLLCASHGKVDTLLSLWYDMLHVYHLHPDIQSYQALLEAYAKIRDVEKAMAVPAQAKEAGLAPTLFFLHKSMVVAAQFGLIQKATEIIRDLCSRNFQVSHDIYQDLILNLYRSPGWDEAVESMRNRNFLDTIPDLIDYTIYLYTCTMLKDHELAEIMKTEMRIRQIKLDHNCYLALMILYNKVERFSATLSVLDEMQANFIRPNVHHYNTCILAWTEQGKLENARHVLHLLRDQDILPDTDTFNILMEASLELDKPEFVLQYMEEMKKDRIEFDEMTYSYCIKALEISNNWEQALEITADMKQKFAS